MLGAVSRRAERGDFVAKWGERCKSDQRPNNSKAKVTNDLLSAVSAQIIQYYAPKTALW